MAKYFVLPKKRTFLLSTIRVTYLPYIVFRFNKSDFLAMKYVSGKLLFY